MIIAIVLSLAALIAAPFVAQKAMGLAGGLPRAALLGLVTLGLMEIIGRVSGYLGPLGGILGMMGFVAAWYQLVKIVHGTDTAKTVVFMFWHLFFLLLFVSILSLFLGSSAYSWWW